MSNLHIHAPLPIKKRLHRVYCQDCKKKTFFVSFYYEWYGASSTCLNCGRNYNNGEWQHLQFYRYARKDNIEHAKRLYRRIAVSTTHKETIDATHWMELPAPPTSGNSDHEAKPKMPSFNDVVAYCEQHYNHSNWGVFDFYIALKKLGNFS